MYELTLNIGEQRRLQKGIASRVYEIERNPTLRPKLFRELQREIKTYFGVDTYKNIKSRDLQQALRYIDKWLPEKPDNFAI
ncbi:ORF6C domain-containing protein [Metabacillus fastidiosus]|uniref:ORF6C domain-containing protein n=1 Tax=Metabacillus fastidiosus TaxID=1458 RepID=UPI002E1BC9D0|nr:ORF6C domain-containing protein [Metabacillus fastidiosus]